jgi:hypothetical protein
MPRETRRKGDTAIVSLNRRCGATAPAWRSSTSCYDGEVILCAVDLLELDGED